MWLRLDQEESIFHFRELLKSTFQKKKFAACNKIDMQQTMSHVYQKWDTSKHKHSESFFSHEEL